MTRRNEWISSTPVLKYGVQNMISLSTPPPYQPLLPTRASPPLLSHTHTSHFYSTTTKHLYAKTSYNLFPFQQLASTLPYLTPPAVPTPHATAKESTVSANPLSTPQHEPFLYTTSLLSLHALHHLFSSPYISRTVPYFKPRNSSPSINPVPRYRVHLLSTVLYSSFPSPL